MFSERDRSPRLPRLKKAARRSLTATVVLTTLSGCNPFSYIDKQSDAPVAHNGVTTIQLGTENPRQKLVSALALRADCEITSVLPDPMRWQNGNKSNEITIVTLREHCQPTSTERKIVTKTLSDGTTAEEPAPGVIITDVKKEALTEIEHDAESKYCEMSQFGVLSFNQANSSQETKIAVVFIRQKADQKPCPLYSS